MIKTSIQDFSLLDNEGNIVQTYRNRACFSEITYNNIDNICKKFVLHINDKTPFSFEEIEKYYKYMTIIGFPMYIVKTNEGFDGVINFEDYKNKLHFVSGLTILRYVCHEGMYSIVSHFLQKIKNYRKVSKIFNILEQSEIAELDAYNRNTNHSLKCYKNIIGHDIVWDRINSCKVSIYSENNVSINKTWSIP